MTVAVSSNAHTLGPALRVAAATLNANSNRILDTTAAALLRRVKAGASGRPGPRVQTGNYRRSWRIIAGTGWRAVGTDAPQGWRLERGFVGADSLGRVYNQPPFPHVGPAVDTVEPLFAAAADAAISQAFAAGATA